MRTTALCRHDFGAFSRGFSVDALNSLNPAGKTTLLQILAGKYMVGTEVVQIMGRPAFHDINLVSSGDLSYLGPQWRRDVAFAGSDIPMQVRDGSLHCVASLPAVWEGRRRVGGMAEPYIFARAFIQPFACMHSCYALILLQGDIAAGKMIFGVEGVDPVRRERLISLLDIDLNWRMNRVSDGQRRRVQIAMGLLKPYKVRHK